MGATVTHFLFFQIIILRKSIKQAFNRTKLELVFKINKIKKKSGPETKLLSRKESELECYKTLKYSDVPLHWAVNKTKYVPTID